MSESVTAPDFLGPFQPLPVAAARRTFFTLELGGAPPNHVRGFAMETQEESDWCWAATAVSVARKYAPATAWTQCRLATEFYDRQGETVECCGADREAGNLPQALSQVFAVTGNLAGEALDEAISFQALTAEIRADRPVCVRIGWRADDYQSGHFIAVTGYQVGPTGVRYVHVQDPSADDDAADNQKDMTFDELTSGYDQGAGDWTWTYRTKP